MAQTLRTFIAVELPEEVKDTLARFLNRLKGAGSGGVRWVEPQGLHITLKFLGNIRPQQVEEVRQAMEEAAVRHTPFTVELSGTGGFPHLQDPRVLWIGIKGEVEALASLHRALDESLAPLGFPGDTRAFSPHVTLGRAREKASPGERRRAGELLSRTPLEGNLRVPVHSLSLMRSILTPEGARYHPLTAVALGRGS